MARANISGGATGALGGAASGAALGSFVPGIGTAIGAIGGGLLGGLSGLFGGGGKKKEKVKQLDTQTAGQKEMMKYLEQALTTGQGPLASLFNFNQEEFNKGVVQPELQNFRENVLPQIQENFIAGNQALGSGMRRGSLKAGQDLQTKLAGLMYQAQQQKEQNKLAGLQTQLGQKPFENQIRGATPSYGESAIAGLLPGIGKGIGSGIGDYIGNLGNKPTAPPATTVG